MYFSRDFLNGNKIYVGWNERRKKFTHIFNMIDFFFHTSDSGGCFLGARGVYSYVEGGKVTLVQFRDFVLAAFNPVFPCEGPHSQLANMIICNVAMFWLICCRALLTPGMDCVYGSLNTEVVSVQKYWTLWNCRQYFSLFHATRWYSTTAYAKKIRALFSLDCQSTRYFSKAGMEILKTSRRYLKATSRQTCQV